MTQTYISGNHSEKELKRGKVGNDQEVTQFPVTEKRLFTCPSPAGGVAGGIKRPVSAETDLAPSREGVGNMTFKRTRDNHP